MCQNESIGGVQTRAARFVNKTFSCEVRVNPMLQELTSNWTPLSEHRARYKATLLYKAIHKLIDLPTEQLALPFS